MQRPGPWLAGSALGAVVGGLWALLLLNGSLERPAWYAYHALFELRGPLPRPQELAIVALDEASLSELGVWPLPRTVYAQLLDGLFAAGARVVALDVTFPQAQQPATDDALAAALKRHQGQVILAANLQAMGSDLAGSETVVYPIAKFARVATVGIVNLDFDSDGGIHRFRPAFQVVDPQNPARMGVVVGFDLAIARAYDRYSGRDTSALPALDPSGDLLINFSGPPRSFPTLSLISVLDAAKDHSPVLGGLKDRAVLVGATSTRMQDQYPTPYSARTLGMTGTSYMAGVEIHANAVETLLSNAPIRPLAQGLQASWLLVLGAAVGALLALMTPWRGLALVLALAAAQVLASLGLFIGANRWLDPATPSFVLATVFVGVVIQHFRTAETARRFYRRTFERYVAKDIVEELLRNPGLAPKMGGERREVTVLFSDIRSFTTISEQRTPEEVVEFLNAYLTAMAEVIHAQHGCIDKYIGDAILALWGNVKPLTPAESAVLGVRTALGMQARVEALRATWEAQGYPRIDIGIGVNTGEAVVGNIGSPEKLEFGVIGDSINVASRLEGLTKEYGGAIVISERTRLLIGERFACTYLDSVKVKGRGAPVEIYSVDREL